MTVTMPPRLDGIINVTPGEVEDARMATEDVELVRSDGTLTEAGQYYVASVRRLTLEEFAMSVKIRHTKSTSGRTHRLTVTTRKGHGAFQTVPESNEITHAVTLRYKTTPTYDDQVQGDLIRKYWAEGGKISPIGRVPEGVQVDPELDAEELERGRPTPRAIAEACYNAIGKPETLTPDQFIGAIMTAVRKDRELNR